MIDVLLDNTRENTTSGQKKKIDKGTDRPIKSFMKSVSWRIVGTLDTMIISYFITGKITVAVSIGSVEVLTKTILYYFHERLWAHIHKIKLKLWKKKHTEQYEFKRVESSAV